MCLYLHDNSPELVKQELLPYAWESTMTNISTEGVQVEDYHQIVNISGDEITFKEPIMHEVDAQWNWKLRKYSYYENVGVEDLTFVGHAVDDFQHHRSWIDDGAYKPIAFMRVVNSWMRRCEFENVSEAASIIRVRIFLLIRLILLEIAVMQLSVPKVPAGYLSVRCVIVQTVRWRMNILRSRVIPGSIMPAVYQNQYGGCYLEGYVGR